VIQGGVESSRGEWSGSGESGVIRRRGEWFLQKGWQKRATVVYRNFCSACAVTVVIFGHFNRFFLEILQHCVFSDAHGYPDNLLSG